MKLQKSMLMEHHLLLLLCWSVLSIVHAEQWPPLKNHNFIGLNPVSAKTLHARSTTECDIDEGNPVDDQDQIGNFGVFNEKSSAACDSSSRADYSNADYVTTEGVITSTGNSEISYNAYKINPPSSRAESFTQSGTFLLFKFEAPLASSYSVYRLIEPDINAPSGTISKIKVQEINIEPDFAEQFLKTSIRVDNLAEAAIFFAVRDTELPSEWPRPPSGVNIERAKVAQIGMFDLYGERYDMPLDMFDPSLDWNQGPADHSHKYSFRKVFFPVSKYPGEDGIVWQDQATFRIYVTWFESLGHSTIELPNNESDYLLVASGESISGDIIYICVAKGKVESEPLSVHSKRVTSSGDIIASKIYDTGSTGLDVMQFFATGGSLTWDSENNKLGWMISRQMLNSHQGCIAVVLDATTLDVVKNTGSTASHSFANSMMIGNKNTDHMFFAVEIGDNYPRGVNAHYIYSDNGNIKRKSKVLYTFKTHHSSQKCWGYPSSGCTPYDKYTAISTPEKTYYKWSNDNNVYSEIAHPAAISRDDGSYMIVFAGERPSLDNSLATSNLNAPRNIALVIVSSDFGSIVSTGEDSSGGYYDFGGGWRSQTNTGIVWLTDFTPSTDKSSWHSATRIKTAHIKDRMILIIYELWFSSSYIRTEVMGVDLDGNVVMEPAVLPFDLRLTPADEIEVIDGRAVIYGFDDDDKRLIRYFLNENTMEAPGIRTQSPTTSSKPSAQPSKAPTPSPTVSYSPTYTGAPSNTPSLSPSIKPVYNFTSLDIPLIKVLEGKKTQECNFEDGGIVHEDDMLDNIGLILTIYSGKCFTNYCNSLYETEQGVVDNGRTPVEEFEAYRISPPSKKDGPWTASETQLLFRLNAPLASSYTVYKLNELSRELEVAQSGLTPKGDGDFVQSNVNVWNLEIPTTYLVIPDQKVSFSPTLYPTTLSPTISIKPSPIPPSNNPSLSPSIKPVYNFSQLNPIVSKVLIGKQTQECNFEDGGIVHEDDMLDNIGLILTRYGDGICYTNYCNSLYETKQGVVDNGRTPVEEFEAYRISPPSKKDGPWTASETQLLFRLNAPLASSYTVYKLNELSRELEVAQSGLTPKGDGDFVQSNVNVDNLEIPTTYLVIPDQKITKSPTQSPNMPSPTPSYVMSVEPSFKPSMVPISSPSTVPSTNPSSTLTLIPVSMISLIPSSVPSVEPTSSPTVTSCDDSPLNMFKNDKTCEWVGKNEKKRCEKEKGEVKYHCRSTCGQCGICVDSTVKFFWKSKKKKCGWVAKKDKRCKNDDLKMTCPKTCGLCD